MTKPFCSINGETWFDTDAVVDALLSYHGICRIKYYRSWQRRLLSLCWVEYHRRRPDRDIEKRLSRDSVLFIQEGFPPYYVRRLIETVLSSESVRVGECAWAQHRLVTLVTPVARLT